MGNNWREQLKNPPAEFRGKPFWAWNGKLEEEELRRQVRVMKRMGLGGFFMHSRVGLETKYLSPDWFSCVSACIDEAKAQGLEAWLYDEDRWPSGFAGGLATKKEKFRSRSLIIKKLPGTAKISWNKDVVAAFAAKVDGLKAEKISQIKRGKQASMAKDADMFVLVFQVKLAEPSEWFNGQTYIDTMDGEAMREFIKITHEQYRKHNSAEFGKAVPGIFTDEPSLGAISEIKDSPSGECGSLPWTAKMLAQFKKSYRYDLIPHLPALAFDVAGDAALQARYHYHDCLTFLFADSFSRQLGEWCGKNKLLFTGHYPEEDLLSSQVNTVGSPMRCYEHMQAPGMDLLTEHWRVFNTAKQVSSVARQFGRKWRISETYGCTGWDFPFLAHKALGDWQVALGITIRCQHLSWYTMLGQAKRDWPASVFFQSPWWESYPKVEDYFARAISLMTKGSEVRDLLVIHPVESVWIERNLGWRGNQVIKEFDSLHTKLTEHLLAAHLDFDFGDEDILSRHGKVAGRADEARIAVGKASYKAVLVPQLKTMRSSTLKLLQKFKAAGGAVIFAGEAPKLVEAVASATAIAFAKGCQHAKADGQGAASLLEQSCRRVSISAEGREVGSALYLLREDAEAFYLFICNTGEDFSHAPTPFMDQCMARDRRLSFPRVEVKLFASLKHEPAEVDLESGSVHAAAAEKRENGWCISTSLPQLGSRLFVFPKQAPLSQVEPQRKSLQIVSSTPVQGDAWEYQLSECNNLVLDSPGYRIGDGEWQGATEILRIDCKLRDKLGLSQRGGGMVQPWARAESKSSKRKERISLRYSFTVEHLPSGELSLALEQPGRYRILVNNIEADGDAENGWWVDTSLRRVPLNPAWLCLGQNEIMLEGEYDAAHPGLEIAYLLGNFGAKVEGTRLSLTALPCKLHAGDWCAQGLPFYSGSITYRIPVALNAAARERVFIHLPDYKGVAARVMVEGKEAGVIAWDPNELEITGYLKEGIKEISVEVLGHRRNSHGPFHTKDKWPVWTGPGEYAGEYVWHPEQWVDIYQLVPCGLTKRPELIIKR